MKFLFKSLTTAAIALIAVAPLSESRASTIQLDGFGYYKLSTKVKYRGDPPSQGGRYSSLGSDYYHNTTYQMDFITNSSKGKSGSLSYEFWGLPYYGSTKGIVLMTRGLKQMNGKSSIPNLEKSGAGIYLDRRRFPEMNIWEYTNKGWQFRDALSFTRKDWL